MLFQKNLNKFRYYSYHAAVKLFCSSYQVHCKHFVIKSHTKKKIPFCEILETEYSIINLLLG